MPRPHAHHDGGAVPSRVSCAPRASLSSRISTARDAAEEQVVLAPADDGVAFAAFSQPRHSGVLAVAPCGSRSGCAVAPRRPPLLRARAPRRSPPPAGSRRAAGCCPPSRGRDAAARRAAASDGAMKRRRAARPGASRLDELGLPEHVVELDPVVWYDDAAEEPSEGRERRRVPVAVDGADVGRAAGRLRRGASASCASIALHDRRAESPPRSPSASSPTASQAAAGRRLRVRPQLAASVRQGEGRLHHLVAGEIVARNRQWRPRRTAPRAHRGRSSPAPRPRAARACPASSGIAEPLASRSPPARPVERVALR